MLTWELVAGDMLKQCTGGGKGDASAAKGGAKGSHSSKLLDTGPAKLQRVQCRRPANAGFLPISSLI